jgi:EAL domain-containing protein (putative c-di-GMP-specific phosphodiesterase class I)
LPGFAQSVSGLLDAYELPASCLCLELTETALLDVNRRTAATLHELKDLGVCLAIDDFGTGYSSLTYLKRFPLDHLKIDRSFVHGLGTDANDTKIVRAVAGLGQALGLTTVAEGVETERQLIGLRALGCDMAQGFYFSPALGRAEFADMLRRDEPLVATR